MKRINLLSEDTSNKIAAGEVVERPSSVVKEIVENCIDAEAKNITISIEDGGQKSILVKDDGIGIHKEDIKLAFMPHATSKISAIDDIYNITTLGFRGEALPSIASISKVNLKSRTEDNIEGTEIILEGGNVVSFKETGCSKGTTIEVKDLFYNVPARQKFLKSTQREGAIISDLMMRMALSHDNINFKYINNGRQVFNTSGNGDLLECIRTLYGKEVFKNVTMFEGHSDVATVYGYIGNQEISRGSRNRQSIFINKRLIKSKLITTAVENAFKSFLTINKYPFFVLFLEIYPELIDVNVHPSKAEIKFKDDRFIFKFIFDSVHHALRESLKDSFQITFDNEEDKNNSPFIDKNNDEKPKEDLNENKKFLVQSFDLETMSNVAKEEELLNKILEQKKNENLDHVPNRNEVKVTNDLDYKEQFEENNKNIDFSIENKFKEPKAMESQDNYKVENMMPIKLKEAKFPELRIIGQFDNTYILAEAFSTLYLIDQHAAHEKILFEKYMKEISEKDVVSQILAIPVIKELTPKDFCAYEENKEIFKDAGFNIEYFGENTINIREIPLLLGELDPHNLFVDMIEDLKNMGEGNTTKVRYNKIATLACKAAVKAKNNLTLEEMRYLLDELRFIDEPFTCPHGRPTILKYTLKEIEKKFKRIQ